MSEPNIPGADAVVANGQRTLGSGRDDVPVAEDSAAPDPWFEPARSADGDRRGHAADGSDDTGWFLPTGRAGLLPDSMTESWEEAEHAQDRPRPAGAPPWAGDRPDPERGAPPPWESGPWPGPGEDRPHRPAAGAPHSPAALSPAAADTGNWQATAALGASILPVVLPGLALGVLGLRRSRITGTGRTASWLAIALSVVWAVILTVWLATAGGTAAGACGSYQSAVSIQVSQVLHDLATGAPQSVLNSDLRQAITQANTAAAQAQQVTARNAMATLTAALQQVEADGSASDAARHQRVAAAAAAMASACKA
jgi:hypothetical protein